VLVGVFNIVNNLCQSSLVLSTVYLA